MSVTPYNWQFDSFSGMDGAMLGLFGAFTIIMFIILGVMLLLCIGLYVFQSLGLYTIANRRGFENPWMAWVPYASSYLMGALADELVVQNGRKDWYMRWWLLGGMCGSLLMALLTMIPFVGILFSIFSIPIAIGCAVIQYFAFNEILKEYDPKNQVLYLVLSIVISPLMSIFTFVIRNKPALHGEGVKRPRVI